MYLPLFIPLVLTLIWVAIAHEIWLDEKHSTIKTQQIGNLPAAEINALQSLFNSTDGNEWHWLNASISGVPWKFTASCNPCAENWQGVTCSIIPTDGFVHVTALKLEFHNLHGALPAALGDLSMLIALALQANLITGTIPQAMGRLLKLQTLYLDGNALSGSIPFTISKLQALTGLSLYLNHLTGTIPPEIGSMSAMQDLALYNNYLTGTIPVSIGNLTALRAIGLDGNRLTGSIPPQMGNLVNITQLFLDTNYLTGTIPSKLGRLAAMQYLDLHANDLTGTIPEELTVLKQLLHLDLYTLMLQGSIPTTIGNMVALSYLALSDNLLTSTVPKSLQQLRYLNALFIYNNQLEGTIGSFLNQSTQPALETLRMNGNRFTGQIPNNLFALPMLQAVVLDDNCFTGTLPVAACTTTHLTTLSLNGLHAGAACRRRIWPGVLQAYVLTNHIRNGIPACLFHMPALNTLHLSGNGLTGSLPADISISANLVDLALSHNQLTGTIPRIFQQRIWYNLDLSYNKLSGILDQDFATVPGNLSVMSQLGLTLINGTTDEYSNPYGAVALRNNRLSDTMPAVIDNMLNISVLDGNLFDCAFSKHDLPRHDDGWLTYSCGSSAFNVPYYVYLGLICVILGMVVIVMRRLIISTWITHTLLWIQFGQENETVGPHRLARYKYVVVVLDEVCKIAAWSTLYIIVVMAPLYALLSYYYGTHTYAYAWTVSAAYLSGSPTLALMLVFFCALLALLLGLFLNLKNIAERRLLGFDHQRQTSHAKGAAVWERRLIGGAVLLINTTVVLGANVAFVLASINAGTELQALAQVALSVFKQLWANVGLVFLTRWAQKRLSTSPLARDGTTNTVENFHAMELLMQLFNLIVVPCLVVAALSPDCFNSAVVASATVTTHFSYPECNILSNNGCILYGTVTASSTYNPPFTYSYQCSASLVTTYAPTFVYMGLFATFVNPVLSVAKRALYQRVPQESKWKPIVKWFVPRILRPCGAATDKPYSPLHLYWDSNHFTVILISYLGVLLTFGLVFPPLALVMLVTICSTVYVARMEVGRFLSEAIADNVQTYSDIIDAECEGVGSLPKLTQAARVLGFVMCGFYALFLFDTLGDAQGAKKAAWVLVVVPLLPGFVLLSARLIQWYRAVQQRTNLAQEDVEKGVELQAVDAVAELDSVPSYGIKLTVEGSGSQSPVFNVLQK